MALIGGYEMREDDGKIGGVDLKVYKNFVKGITSLPSKDNEVFAERIKHLSNNGVNIASLSTAALGLPGEAGEFCDLIKKILFHGKEYTPEIQEKLEKELGDVFWYAAQACIGLNVDPYYILQKNMDKLNGRYEGGKFTVSASENRKPGDD